jgi:hypothetical protein
MAFIVRAIFGDTGGPAECPTGRPTARIDTFSANLLDPFTPMYQLDVDFEVVNEASAAIVVLSVEASVTGEPDAGVVAHGAGQVPPGGTVTVQGSGFASGDGMAPPTPDSGSVVLDATWAEVDHAGCDL